MSITPADDDLARFAADPTTWGDPQGVLTGSAAADYGRSLLEAAGVDTTTIARDRGRPRIGGAAPKGTRSPKVNVAIDPRTNAQLDALARSRGLTRSQVVRNAIDDYVRRAS